MDTTIRVNKDTRRKLADLCHKDESFDDLLQKLIEIYIKTKGGKSESV